jgi:hypothetical protein
MLLHVASCCFIVGKHHFESQHCVHSLIGWASQPSGPHKWILSSDFFSFLSLSRNRLSLLDQSENIIKHLGSFNNLISFNYGHFMSFWFIAAHELPKGRILNDMISSVHKESVLELGHTRCVVRETHVGLDGWTATLSMLTQATRRTSWLRSWQITEVHKTYKRSAYIKPISRTSSPHIRGLV